MKPPINSKKHYVQTSQADITAGALLATTLITALPIADVNTVQEVQEGAIIKAVYIEWWLRGTTNQGSSVFIICKLPAGANDITTTEIAALGNWDNKKNVLYCCQGLTTDSNTHPIAGYKGWLKIPKGKQRFGLGDKLKIFSFAQNLDLTVCGFATYKEYT